MADPNTCEQCGISNHNKPKIVIRQSGKGKLVCQPCYDIINPPEVEVEIKPIEKFGAFTVKEEKKPIVSDKLFYPNEQSLSSSKTQEEKGTVRSGIRRLSR